MLETSGWIYLDTEPIKSNFTLVHQFYANAIENNFVKKFVLTV